MHFDRGADDQLGERVDIGAVMQHTPCMSKARASCFHATFIDDGAEPKQTLQRNSKDVWLNLRSVVKPHARVLARRRQAVLQLLREGLVAAALLSS